MICDRMQSLAGPSLSSPLALFPSGLFLHLLLGSPRFDPLYLFPRFCPSDHHKSDTQFLEHYLVSGMLLSGLLPSTQHFSGQAPRRLCRHKFAMPFLPGAPAALALSHVLTTTHGLQAFPFCYSRLLVLRLLGAGGSHSSPTS